MKSDNRGAAFYPNDLKEEDIPNLEPWQLLVSACHFGPKMGDCVELNYGYTIEVGSLSGDTEIFCDNISLNGDIDMSEPIESLERYAGFDWKAWATAMIAEKQKREEIND